MKFWVNTPTPKKRGQVKMAVDGPAQGTNMGSMQALNTSSSVNGATTWFLNQRMSLKHSIQNHGSAGRHSCWSFYILLKQPFIIVWFDIESTCQKSNDKWFSVFSCHGKAGQAVTEAKSCVNNLISLKTALQFLRIQWEQQKSSTLNASPKASRTPSIKLQGQSIASCIRGPRNRTWSAEVHTWDGF